MRVEIPRGVWADVQAELQIKSKERQGAKKSKKKQKKDHILVRLTYNLKDRKFVDYGVTGTCSLFFEHAAAATKEDVSKEYFTVQMNDCDEEYDTAYSYDVDPLRETILREGIGVEDQPQTIYNLIGCSNSQVQKHCYVFRRSPGLKQNESRLLRILPKLKELEQKKGVPKRVKYTGLLFSGITAVPLPTDDKVYAEEIESKENKDFDFTDGPGLISKKLALWVTQQLGLGKRCPSVFQIRFCGKIRRLGHQQGASKGYVCKGVLLVDPSNTETYRIQVRKSMLKVEASDEACKILHKTLGICEHSRPIPGRLGPQQVCLLSGTVAREDLLKIQNDHLECQRNAFVDSFSMAWMLALERTPQNWKNFHKLMISERGESVPASFRKCCQTLERVTNNGPKKTKVQLPLAASRTLFGAVFPEVLHDLLDEGDCVVLLENGPLKTETTEDGDSYVIVSRSPSYHPGDIRVLRLVCLPEGHPALELRNCILFSTKGHRPDPDKMGGGDLDGDMYLVLWHPVLLKYSTSLRALEPADYNGPIIPNSSGAGASRRPDWIHYAAMTDNSMLGEVESTFYKLAKKHGVRSTEIASLNTLFASLVDRHATSLEAFQKLKYSVADEGPSHGCVWEEMAARQSECLEVVEKTVQKHIQGDRLASYRVFYEAAKPTSQKETLMARMANASFHFQECILQPQVANTLSLLISSAPTNPVPGASAPTGNADSPRGNNAVLFRELEIKMANEERDFFRSFEKRTFALFRPALESISGKGKGYKQDAKKQEERRFALCCAHDEEMESLISQQQRVDSAIDQLEREHKSWLEGHRKALASQEEAIRGEKERAALDLRIRRQSIEPDHEAATLELNRVNCELNGMWYLAEAFSDTKRAAYAQQRIVLDRINKLEVEMASLSAKADEMLRSVSMEVNCAKITAQDIELQESSKMRQKLDRLKDERHGVELAINDATRNHDALMNGAEKAKLEELIEAKKTQSKELLSQQQGATPTETGKGSILEQIVTAVDALRKNLEAMFCPTALKQASESLKELQDERDSLLLGREHILRQLSFAKLRWNQDLAELNETRTAKRRTAKWQEVISNLERVFELEQNRLLGCPRGPKGTRCGPLPVYYKRAELQKHLRTSQALVVTAGTGCGKSTQVPQYIADDFYSYRDEEELDEPIRLCCTQPRRVAAEKVASRVATEYKTDLGNLVGFRVGSRGRSKEDCNKTSNGTVIEFVTEGLLLFNLARSPTFIEKYDGIIIDEMHERNTEQDLCLSLLRDYLERSKTSRPSFKVVVMSASIDAQKFCDYFGNCPTMDCPGRNFPVEEHYEPISVLSRDASLVEHAVKVLFEDIVEGAKDTQGDVLIFLAGSSDIDACVSKIRSEARESGQPVVAYPLYSRLDGDSIAAATNPEHRCGLDGETKKWKSKHCIRKVICTTNIAETSLTIDGVRFVIESGRAKKVTYDHTLRCAALSESWVSHASTIQRRGRAGRTNTGFCYYLYEKEFHEREMERYDTPKILEEPIDMLILFSMQVFNQSINGMRLLDTPKQEDINDATERLKDLGILEGETTDEMGLTKDGKIACALSRTLRPESCRMMLHCFQNYPQLAEKAMKLAVLMSSTDSIFDVRAAPGEQDAMLDVHGDHILSLKHFEWFEGARKKTKNDRKLKAKCHERGVNFRILASLQLDVGTIHKEMKRRNALPPNEQESGLSKVECLLRSMIAGYFHHIVACVEPEYTNRLTCKHLAIPELSLQLDRDSVLNKLLAPSRPPEMFVDDGTEQREGKQDDLTVVMEQEVKPHILLYGNLKKNARAAMPFMVDASVVESEWVLDVIPTKWAERVHFDPVQKSCCRMLIKNLGPKLLNECCNNEAFEEMKTAFSVDALDANFRHRLIVITGTQQAVSNAEECVKKLVRRAISRFVSNDKAQNMPLRLVLGAGLNVIDRLSMKSKQGQSDNRKLHEIFSAYGTNDREHTSSAMCADITFDRRKDHVKISPLRGVTMSALKRCFNGQNLRLLPPSTNHFTVQCRSGEAESIAKRLKQNPSFLSVAVGQKSFLLDSQRIAMKAVGWEARWNSVFWQGFVKAVGTSREGGAAFTFARSIDCFLFCPGNHEPFSAFRSQVIKMANFLAYHTVAIPVGFQLYHARRFVSILAEVRKQCTNTAFLLVEAKRVDDESERNTGNLSDYDWVLTLVKSKKIESISICFTSLDSLAVGKARTRLEDCFSSEAMMETDTEDDDCISNLPSGCERGKCVMCRRDIFIRVKRNDYKADASALAGWNLSLCGCSYCRECFLNGATETLKDDVLQSARCLCCNREEVPMTAFELFWDQRSFGSRTPSKIGIDSVAWQKQIIARIRVTSN